MKGKIIALTVVAVLIAVNVNNNIQNGRSGVVLYWSGGRNWHLHVCFRKSGDSYGLFSNILYSRTRPFYHYSAILGSN